MTTDRELIELAARAMGRTVVEWEDDHKDGTYAALMDNDTWFQPLHPNYRTDCMGDALRLAVALQIRVSPLGNAVQAQAFEQRVQTEVTHIDDGSCAATRRAITRAAAEIARAQTKKETPCA